MDTDDRPQQRAPTGGRWVASALLVAGVVLLVVGVVAWVQQSGDPGPEAAGPTATDGTGEQEVVDSPDLPNAERASWRPGAPRRVLVPVLDIDAPVVPIEAPGGVLTPPADPQVLGWWAAGAKPGARTGSALVTGHTVHSGGGAMDDLEQVEAGDRIWVRTARGKLGYDVRSVVVLGKGELAERAERLFSQQVPGRLVLITCEDWNGVEYLSNVVVTATPSA
ncbi:class F sortase [Nocardioides sp.]|uniref:class F sortase n=1 Tax=Nocardioides sp. TaxID=35761 RepID=UPI002ED43DC8